MLQIFPFLDWLAIITSAALIVGLWTVGELGPRGGAILLGWLAIGGWCQFLGASSLTTTLGLVLQTILAIYLILRWKLSAW